MHIPDNYLSPATCGVLGAAALPALALAVDRVRKELPREKLPLLGIGAAFSFLIMMFNIPVPGGTTAHAVGGVLIAALMGPWAASVSVTVALIVQALLFGDGGILALGANVLNMAVVMPFVGYFVYKLFKGRAKSRAAEYAGLAIGAYLALNAAALFAAVEFGVQPALFRDAAGMPMYCPYPLAVSVPAMMIPHLVLVGFVEAAFTVAVVAFIQRVSPGIVYQDAPARTKPVLALLAALVALSPLGLLAAGTAWGEWGAGEIASVAEGGKALGYVPSGMQQAGFQAPVPDYALNGLPAVAGYILSAVAGAAILVIAFKLIAALRPARKRGA